MKRSKISEAQVALFLRQADEGATISVVFVIIAVLGGPTCLVLNQEGRN